MTGTTTGGDWQRLDPRMMLVHPVRDALRLWPVLLGLVLFGGRGGEDGPGTRLQLLVIVVPVVVGLVRYLTTTYRLTDGRVELRRGLLSRRTTSARLDRVRTVDLTASPVHRLVGLTTVRIGTGTSASDDDGFDLDGLPPVRARELRDLLLTASSAASGPTGVDVEGGPVAAAGAREQDRVVAAFSASWLRYAPLTGSGFVVAAAALGGLFQVASTLQLGRRVRGRTLPIDGVAAVITGLVVALLIVTALSVVGYLVTEGGFRLVRRPGAGGGRGSWHVSRGLLTRRETTIDEDRLAGVVVREPLALRLGGGGHLDAIVTGLRVKERGSSSLVPAAPASVVRRAAAAVVGSAATVEAPLVGHGPAAARRRVVRVAVPALLPLGGAVVLAVDVSPGWWVAAVVVVLAATGLARDRIAGLGHAVVEGHLVARSGSLARRRDVLAAEHVIGVTLRATWFQRRVGLVTLVVTTAGGRQRVVVLDVPAPDALSLAGTLLPGPIGAFTDPGPARTGPARVSGAPVSPPHHPSHGT